MYWPSFNAGAAATGDAQQRAVINTYLALCAACCSAFAVSALVNHERKFVMEHIQNATLAGGVAVGAVADMILTPFGSLIMGVVAGSVSTIGYEFVSVSLKQSTQLILHVGSYIISVLAAVPSEEAEDHGHLWCSQPPRHAGSDGRNPLHPPGRDCHARGVRQVQQW